MYIPKPALEDCLTSEISASGGDVMYDYITGSQIRRIHYFGNTSGSVQEFEIHEGCTDSTQLFVLGGGGAGGFGEKQTNGSGPPYNLSPPSSFIGCTNTATQTAGGGGAGGALFINPQRELTGSLELVPGKYDVYVGQGGLVSGSGGEDSYFKYAYRLANDADIPSGSASASRYDYDSLFIKGGGGGQGGSVTWAVTLDATCGIAGGTPHWQQFAGDGRNGGSGGGGANTFCGDGQLYIGDSGSVEFPFRNQGHEGLWYYNPDISSPDVTKGNGGGGYGSTTSSIAGEQNNGGEGASEYIRGFKQLYGIGGNAQNSDSCGTAGVTISDRDLFNGTYESGSQMPFYKGSGGQAFVQEYTSSLTDTYQDGYFRGVSGEVIISYALTGSQLTNGKLHYIDGGVDGGIFSFIPCGEVRLETLEVPAGKQACICAMDTGQPTFLGGTYQELWYREDDVDLQNPTPEFYEYRPEKQLDQLPSGSGTVTFTTGSECNSYVEFQGWENCSFCQESAPAGIYIGFDISGSSGRTTPLPYYKYPDTTIHYTSSQNYITSSRYNNHDSESYFETRIGAFSNDYDDDTPFDRFPYSASFSTSYDDQNVDFTTGSSCFTYYDCDPLDERPITASGGDEVGDFISGSYVYKYHIFHPSGSSASTREFQEFTVTNGYGADLQMYIAGGGGPGGRATTSGTSVFGGGGGAGEIYLTPIQDLCQEISMSISPGWGMPYAAGHSWTYLQGNTIVSASNFTINALGGGQGGDYNEFPAELAEQFRSGSGGGGAGVPSSVRGTWKAQLSATSSYFLQTDGGNGWSGSVAEQTGSAGGGGGYLATGSFGTEGLSAEGGRGGDGIRLNLDGTLKYYGGGGGGYGPGGPGNGGLGGTHASLTGTASGSLGAGGGATDNSSTWVAPWGTSYTGGGRGGDGTVILTYRWKYNDTPTGSIAIRGLSQYYDMYDLNSYDGTGSLVYSLWKNEHTASLENDGGWRYDTDNLGSGSLLIVSQSLKPFVQPEIEQSGQISALTVWEVNNQTYDSDGLLPILTDEQFGTSSIGIYGGNDELYGEAVVIKIGDTIVTTESGSAGGFIPRGGFHISQFSYNQGTNEVYWYVDGFSGSAVVNETIDDKSILFNFNSSSVEPVGLGNNSVYNVTAIYTASLDWNEMRHSDDFLYPRY